MFKTITLRVSKEELHQIDKLREQHLQIFKVSISQSQLIRNLILEKWNESNKFKVKKDDIDEKEVVFIEKEEAHKRDMAIIDRLRISKWGKVR